MRTSTQNREDSRGIVKGCQRQKILFIFIVVGAVLGIVLLMVFTIGGQETCSTAPCLMLLEKLLKVQNTSIDPCEDFFNYACGNWEASHMQEMNMSLMNVFDVLLEENQLIVRKLLEKPQHGINSSAKEKALRFYTSCMNTEQIEARGAQPLKELINEIGGWNITGSWKVTDFNQTLQILMKRYNTFPFFKAYVGPSSSDPSTNIIQIDHPEFDLPPDTDFKKSPTYPEVLRSYFSYLMKLGSLMGGDPVLTNIYISETIAFISNLQMLITPLKTRQEKKMLFYSTTIEELQQNAPSIDWLACLQAVFHLVQLNMSQSIVVHDMDYLKNMSQLIKEWQSKRDVLQIYMMLCLVRNLSPALDRKFEEAHQELKEKLNRRTTKMVKTERWRKCLSETSTFFGPVLGEMVGQEIFPTKAKDLAKQMFSEIQDTIHSHLDQLEWMETQSREEAKGKIYNLRVEIGYPESTFHKSEVDDEYQELDIYEDNFFHNVVVCLSSLRKMLLLRLINPHLPDSWEVAPWSVHSYYSLRRHAVVFPAGMFRSPFFHPEFPSAVNFGAMGFFMAHELLHSLHDYVMPKNCFACNMKPLTQGINCLVKQYENYSLKGHSINGSFTLQENAADTGGLNIAFQAYKNWLAKHRWVKNLPESRFSHHQLFFISFAHAMCGHQSLEELETFHRDLHSPPPLRVLGSLSNCQEFSRHFNCPKGSPMNPVQKCRIW